MTKGRATPKRRESERKKKNPVIPRDRKEAARKAREDLKQKRQLARQGYREGNERYLPLRDRGVQKKRVREYVDSNIFVSEFLMPVILLVLVLSLIPSIRLQIFLEYFLIILFAVLLTESTLLAFRIKRVLSREFSTFEKGVRLYAISRMVVIRPLRMPKTSVKLGLVFGKRKG